MASSNDQKSQKSALMSSQITIDEEFLADGTDPKKLGTRSDLRDMWRLGKEQQFQRNFGFLSILGFTCVTMGTWEAQFGVSIFGLINGGLGGLVWIFLATFVCWSAVIASISEIASMAPTSGGQYHWVSEFAPPSASKFLSYITGWVCVLGWQIGITATASNAAGVIQSLLVINHSSYVPQNWQVTLFIIAISFIAVFFNTSLATKLPLVGGILLLLHICGFFTTIVPLWVLAPRGTPEEVFAEFSDGGNWGNLGLSCLVGMLSPIFSLLGADSATHMSEEVKDASRVMPYAIMATCLLNGILGFFTIVTFCFTLGDVDEILSDPNVLPFVQVFLNTTNSHVGTSIMTSIIIILISACCITSVATASRQLFAFARDGGVPFGKTIAYIRPGSYIPLNAIIASFIFTFLLSLFTIGPSYAFNTIASVGPSGLVSSYIIPIACVSLKRWRKEPLPTARWSLGKWGGLINDFSLGYLCLVFVFLFFPQATPVTPESMNWAVVMYAFLILFALGFYFLQGRKTYISPVVLVRKEA